jgi:hypothetical protein
VRDLKNAYKILAAKSEGNRPLGIYSGKYEDDTKMDLMEIGLDLSGSG